MPSWPAETKYISHSTQRVDGEAKVTGRARYSSDIQAEGWLYGMILRSKWPSAKILSVNLDKARQVSGIKAAVVVRDMPFTIRFYGEEIAAVAGTSKQACLDALRAIDRDDAQLGADVAFGVEQLSEFTTGQAVPYWQRVVVDEALHIADNAVDICRGLADLV
ncbi:MAG: hypothetical protein RL616_1567, partial [Verrucomicrobiota bacterium]